MVDFHWTIRSAYSKGELHEIIIIHRENLLESTYQMLTQTCQQELHFYTFRQAHASTQRLDLHFPIQKQ